MQYDAKTPREYLELLERDWRRDKLLDTNIEAFIKRVFAMRKRGEDIGC